MSKQKKAKKTFRPRIEPKSVYSTCKYVEKLVKIYENSVTNMYNK